MSVAKYEAEVERPDDVQITVTVTMSLGAWKKAADALAIAQNESHQFCRHIRETVQKVERTSVVWDHGEKI